MTIDETRELLAILGDLYPNARFSPTADATWHRVLAPYPAAAVMAAVDRHGRDDGTFAPNAYALVSLLEAAMRTERSADDIWGAIQEALRGHNPDHKTAGLRKIREIDELAGDVIEHVLSWETIGYASIEDRRFLFGRFRDALEQKRLDRDRAPIRAELPEIEAGSDPWPGPLPMLNPVANGWQKAGEA